MAGSPMPGVNAYWEVGATTTIRCAPVSAGEEGYLLLYG